MTYFAIMLSTNELPGNRFFNAAVSTLVEMVTVMVCWLIIEYIDRRKTYIIFSFITAVALAMAPILTPSKYTKWTFLVA